MPYIICKQTALRRLLLFLSFQCITSDKLNILSVEKHTDEKMSSKIILKIVSCPAQSVCIDNSDTDDLDSYNEAIKIKFQSIKQTSNTPFFKTVFACSPVFWRLFTCFFYKYVAEM